MLNRTTFRIISLAMTLALFGKGRFRSLLIWLNGA